MSIKSKTHKGTGFNELRFEDKKGEEEIYVHAEKDYRRLIKNNEIVKIEGELKVNVIQASEKKAKSIQITANDFIEFNLGANQIKMTPTQITVAGKNVSIKGQGITTIQGGMVKINAGGGGASQAKASIDNMAVGAKTGEFGGFGKNVTEEISFTEKTKSTAPQGGGAPPSKGGYGKDDAASLALDAMPVVGVLKGIAQVIVGKDLITGETLNRGAEALATVAGILPGGKVAAKVGMKVAGKNGIIGKNSTSIFKSENVLGRKVFKNNRDVTAGKPYFVDDSVNKSIRNKIDNGWTNKKLMEAGYSPIGPDGKQVNLHHLIGKEPGSMVELTSTFHKNNHKPLHGLIEKNTSFRNDPKLQYQYKKFKKQYWKERAKDF